MSTVELKPLKIDPRRNVPPGTRLPRPARARILCVRAALLGATPSSPRHDRKH